MARLCGACCGLLIFSAIVVCGLLAGNAVQLIVQRAVVGLFGGLALGCLLGWVGMLVVNDSVAPLRREPEEAADQAEGSEARQAEPS